MLGEEVSDEVYQDIMLNGLTAAPEFRFIRDMHYRDEFTSVDHLQQTANRYYIEQRSRNASGSTTPKRDVLRRVEMLSSLRRLPSCLRRMLVVR